MHSISVLGKEAKSLFYIKILDIYLYYTLTHKGRKVLTAINKVSEHIAYIVDRMLILSNPCIYDMICLT